MQCEIYYTLQEVRLQQKQFDEETFRNLHNIKCDVEAMVYNAKREDLKEELGFARQVQEIKKAPGACGQNIPNLIYCKNCKRSSK